MGKVLMGYGGPYEVGKPARGGGKYAKALGLACDRIEELEIALRAALSFMQERHTDHNDGHAQMVIAAVRGALRKERD